MELNDSNIPNSLVSDSGTQPGSILPADTESFADKLNAPDPLAGSESDGISHSGPLIILGVVVLAVGSLFFMKFLATASAGGGEQSEDATTVDDFIQSLSDGSADHPFGENSKGSLEVLTESYISNQIPLADVRKDAFHMKGGKTNTQGEVSPVVVTKGVNDDEAWLNEVRSAAEDCELKSVMGGSNPLANINGNILQLGDSFTNPNSDITFQVKIIDSDSVLLEAGSDDLKLTTQVKISINRN